tara:strand:+ start:364 stop:690 length:327 start_codon:yes stop_codon:yes gene_type:complete
MNNTEAFQAIIEAQDAANAVILRQIWADEAQEANRADVDDDTPPVQNGVAVLSGPACEHRYGATGTFNTYEGNKYNRVLVDVAGNMLWVHVDDISFGTVWTPSGVMAR